MALYIPAFGHILKIQCLSNEAKLLALYLLTGPHTNMLGCFRLPASYVAEDLGWDLKTVSKRFNELNQITLQFMMKIINGF